MKANTSQRKPVNIHDSKRFCRATEDRDVHSAINILNEGLRAFRAIGSLEHVKTPVELSTSVNTATQSVGKLIAMNQEAIAI